jgi:quinol monooxygenase YgiN
MKHLALFCSLCAFPFFTPTYAQDADPLAPIKAQVKDHNAPFTLIVEFKVKPDQAKAFKKLIRQAVTNTRKEPGNAVYSTHADTKDENTIVFTEVWRSMEALQSHVGQEYTKALLGSAKDMCEAEPTIRVLLPLTPDQKAKPKTEPKTEIKPAEPSK